MRKITAILIVLSMLFALAACKKKCEHEYSSTITKEATCAEEGLRTYTCSKCGDTYTEAIAKSNDHTYASEVVKEATVSEEGTMKYTCSLCGYSYTDTIAKIQSKWMKENMTDDFGDPTGKWYYRGLFVGEFSNSATRGSELLAEVSLSFSEWSPELVAIGLYEYGSSLPYFRNSDVITFKVKDSKGNVRSYDTNHTDSYISVNDADFRKQIETERELSVVISNGNTTYKFTIDNIGLAEILES